METPLSGLIVASFPTKSVENWACRERLLWLFLDPTPSHLIALNLDFLLLLDSESSRVSTQFSTNLKAVHCGFSEFNAYGNFIDTHSYPNPADLSP